MPRGFADLQFVCAIVFQLRFCSYCFVVVVIAVWQLLQLHFIVVIVAAACRVQSTNEKRVQPLYRHCFVIYRYIVYNNNNDNSSSYKLAAVWRCAMRP